MTERTIYPRAAWFAFVQRYSTKLILVTVLLVSLGMYREVACGCGSGSTARKAKIAAARQDVLNMKLAIAMFHTENFRYPTTAEGIAGLVTNRGHLVNWTPGLVRVPLDPWGRQYVYRYPGTNRRNFDLFSTGSSGEVGNADNVAP